MKNLMSRFLDYLLHIYPLTVSSYPFSVSGTGENLAYLFVYLSINRTCCLKDASWVCVLSDLSYFKFHSYRGILVVVTDVTPGC